jgi:hypothetical protein
MHYPVKLILQRVQASAAIEASVFDAVTHLEHSCDYILGCQVFIRGPEVGDDGVYAVSLTLRTSDREITIAESRVRNPEHRDIQAALRDTFVRAGHELRKLDLPQCSCREASAPDLHQGARIPQRADCCHDS